MSETPVIPDHQDAADRFARWFLAQVPAETCDEHLSEELLVGFATATLTDVERPVVVRHLASCAECRRTAQAMAEEAEAIEFVQPSEPPSKLGYAVVEQRLGTTPIRRSRVRFRPQWLASAAAVLLTVGFGWWWFVGRSDPAAAIARSEKAVAAGRYGDAISTLEPLLHDARLATSLRDRATATARRAAEGHAESLLAARQFEAVQSLHDRMARLQIGSARLDVLAGQAWLRHDRPLALLAAGSLFDLGYLPGSPDLPMDVKSPASAYEMVEAGKALESALARDPNDRLALLNYGYWLLRQNKADEAREQFARVLERDATDADASLGQGLAAYTGGDFSSAADAFRRIVAGGLASAHVELNLAMCLDRLGRPDAARHLYETARQKLAEPELRDIVTRRIDRLRRPESGQRPGS